MITTESTIQLASQLMANMQRRQIDMAKLSIRFHENIIRHWIQRCKQLHIWPGYPHHQGLIDIYA